MKWRFEGLYLREGSYERELGRQGGRCGQVIQSRPGKRGRALQECKEYVGLQEYNVKPQIVGTIL